MKEEFTGDWTVYESEDSDEVVLSVRIDRTHDDWGTGSTTGALDSNADSGDRLLITAANLSGRAQISASWYDRFGRVTDQAQYGTNGGSNFDRDGLSVPSRSDTVLVTSYTYDPAQGYTETTDPKGLVARVVVDDAGRTTSEIRNYSSGVNSGLPASPDDNQTVRYEYVDGLRTKIIADMPSGESDQTTVYFYGTAAGTPAGQVLWTGDRLRAVKYPDSDNAGTTTANINSDSSDVVSYSYNAQGQEIYRKDQAGSVYESDYDTSGRRTHERVTALASGFDGAVLRKSWTYDSLGRSSLVTQYDNATVGSGSVTDEVSYAYDGWGGITSYKQDKDSAVGGSGYYEVAYAYEKATGGRQTVRRNQMTLPGGKAITIDYSKDVDDEISRVSKLKDGATNLAKYEYLGAGRVVGTIYLQPNIARTEYDTSSNGYNNYLDVFSRVVSSTWWTLAPNPDKVFYDCDISYDRNSNITWVEDNVHSGFDALYTMDDLDRLVDAEEGTRSGASITTRTRQQTWTTLDHVGNWDVSKLDLNGDGDFVDSDELNETRTSNGVNELEKRNIDSSGGDEFTLVYDAAGNMTNDGEDYEYMYDAFYRLREVWKRPVGMVPHVLIAEYRYNGLGHMIGVHEDTEADNDLDSNDVWFYPAYDEAWREVARYRDTDSSPKEQFVNAMAGLDGYGRSSYINDVVCRERDNTDGWLAASDGTLEERYFYCPNWRGDVSVLVHSGRYMAEWVKYSAYGVPFGLPGGDTNSDGDNDAADATQIQTLINANVYDVRGDVDLDGDVDSTDKTLAQGAPVGGSVLGREVLGSTDFRSGRGYGGYVQLAVKLLSSRARAYSPSLSSWTRRDPIEYGVAPGLYEYSLSAPLRYSDPTGLSPQDSHTGIGAGKRAGRKMMAPLLVPFPYGKYGDGYGIDKEGFPFHRDSELSNHMRHCVGTCVGVKTIGMWAPIGGVLHEVGTMIGRMWDPDEEWDGYHKMDAKRDISANTVGTACALVQGVNSIGRESPVSYWLGLAPSEEEMTADCEKCCFEASGTADTGSNGVGGQGPGGAPGIEPRTGRSSGNGTSPEQQGPGIPGARAPGAPSDPTPGSGAFRPFTPWPGEGSPGASGGAPGPQGKPGRSKGAPSPGTPGAGAAGAPGSGGSGLYGIPWQH